jgi:hypothetical protein
MTSQCNRVISCGILNASRMVADISSRHVAICLPSVYAPLLEIVEASERGFKAIRETFTCDSSDAAERRVRFLRSKRRGGVIRFCTPCPDRLEESLHGAVADNGGTCSCFFLQIQNT